jgi:hypothetical protein
MHNLGHQSSSSSPFAIDVVVVSRRAFARRAVAIVVVFGRRIRRHNCRRHRSLSSSPVAVVVIVVSHRAFAGRAE